MIEFTGTRSASLPVDSQRSVSMLTKAPQDDHSHSHLRIATIIAISFVSVTVAAQLAARDWLRFDTWMGTYAGYGILIWVASIHTPRAALVFGYAFGLISMATSFWWAEQMLAYSLNTQGVVPWIVFCILVAWESIPFAIFAFLVSYLRQTHASSLGLLVPISVWILFESLWPRVFPWEIGHSQLACLPLAQIADLGGGQMITWVVLWCASLPRILVDLRYGQNRARRRRAAQAIPIVLVMLLIDIVYGLSQLSRWNAQIQAAPPYTIGCIQENPSDVTSISRLRTATDNLADKVDVICWPESTLGTHSQELKSFSDLLDVARASLPPVVDTSPLVGLPTPLIVGGKSFSGAKHDDVAYQQTAFLVDSAGHVLAHYHKRGLMPLGEYVPGEQYLPGLHDWFQLGNYFLPGVDDRPMKMPDGTLLGVLICYEDISADIVRRTCLAGAEVFVCIINASAFEQPIALYQHLRLAQLRSIENRRFIVRVAGTGISCTITPTGEVLQTAAPYTSASFVAKTCRLNEQTYFSRFGNIMLGACATIVTAFGFATYRRPKGNDGSHRNTLDCSLGS